MEIKGLSGLTNLGNTCYMNSCLQILSHSTKLNEIVSEHISNNNNNTINVSFVKEWHDLREILWSGNKVISPNRFVNIIQQIAKNKGFEEFTGYDQNDFTEFFVFIMDLFHENLSRKTKMNLKGEIKNKTDQVAVVCYQKLICMYENEYSSILRNFYGLEVTQLLSPSTKNIEKTIAQPYIMLSLPIPENNKTPTLLDCLDLYVEPEILIDSNRWYNEKTKSYEDVVKCTSFWDFPEILVISFKRFNYKGNKTRTCIDFPLENLNLSKYVKGYNKDSYTYDLYGVANHTGVAMGGHYTSYINIKNKWYHFNDTNVVEVSENKIVSPQAYCLFYRKKLL